MTPKQDSDAEKWLKENNWDYSKYGDRRGDRSAYDTMMNYEISGLLDWAFNAGRASMAGEVEALKTYVECLSAGVCQLSAARARLLSENGTLRTEIAICEARDFARAVEMLRSEEANKKCCENTLGTGNFVSHTEWATWLEEKLNGK